MFRFLSSLVNGSPRRPITRKASGRYRRLTIESLEERQLLSSVPATPVLQFPALQSPTAVQLAWTDVAGETGYRVAYKVDGTSSWQLAGSVGQNVTRAAIGNLSPGTKYDF